MISIQSTLVISNSLIWNNLLSRSENLVPVLTQSSTNRQQNVWKRGEIAPLFHNLFNISLTWESNYVFIRLTVFLSSANLVCRSTDISKYFMESLGVRDNESRLYIKNIEVYKLTSKYSTSDFTNSIKIRAGIHVVIFTAFYI